MFNTSSVIVGLEVGTSKVCAVVGEVNPAGVLNIIGLGQHRSRGVRKGEIADVMAASEDIRNAIVEAEAMADVEIRSVYLGVTGSHIRGLTNRGVHQIVSEDREIGQREVDQVIQNAKAFNLPNEHHVLHWIRQHFLVNGQDGISDPVGMSGSQLELDMHVVHGNFNRLQNPIRVVKGLQLEVEDIVFNGLASSLSVLTPEQKEMGALVIDMGGGSTDYVVYREGIIQHSGVLAVGGDHISNDLACGLKIPLSRAEQLKIEHGAAMVFDNASTCTLSATNELGIPQKPVNLEHLQRIMSARLDETFQLIEEELGRAGMLEYLKAGVVLCGGGARIPGIDSVAERMFQMPCVLGKTSSISGLKSALDQPEFVTAIGIVRYGYYQEKKKRTQRSFRSSLRDRFGGLFGRVR